MDVQAANLLATLKRPAASSSAKLDALNALKSDIKHYRVPEAAQATIFECLKVCITQQASSTLASSAFSTLGHLIKRLRIQDASGHSISQLAPRLFPALQERMGDMREAIRISVSTALTELYPLLTSDVEAIIRDEAIGGNNPRAKQTGLLWVAKMHKEEQMPFKAYTQAMVARLEDSDGNVRETAKNVLIELFSNAPDRAKTDLKKQMKVFSVRVSIEQQILAGIGSSSQPLTASRPQTAKSPEPEYDMAASTRSLPTLDHAAHFAAAINSEAAQPPPQETVQFDPLYVQSRHELEDTFRDMLPHFEGKETEQNWTPRDKSILKLRRLTKGNAPSEYHRDFMAGIKSMTEGILKVANSLRTTMSTNGCQLVQELARTLGPALDSSVEMFMQAFVKMSAATKHIAAENGKMTCNAMFQHCSVNSRTMQHIWYAAQEKNVQVRQCVPTWLKTVLKRQSSYKSHFESSGGLELAEKCIKKGLDDANPKVKEGMRGAYWTFAQYWPDKADVIMRGLDPKSKTALEKDSGNPNASLHASTASAAPAARQGAASRNALREMMAEQRKAKAAGKLPDRPVSAMAELSPRKQRPPPSSSKSHLSTVSRNDARVVSNASTASERTPQAPPTATRKGSALMSGPVRRPRRPELVRPQTADPYASKRGMMRPETPADDTPSNSPPKGTTNSKASVLSSSAARSRAKTAGTIAGSPGSSPVKRSPRPAAVMHSQSSRPNSKGSGMGEDLSSVREDDFTMVMPKASESARPGHKRPGLGQTMSVDNGVVGLGEEDGFTMVMPNLSSQEGRARSPLAYRSPLKQMFDEARARADASISPKPENRRGIDETMENRTGTPRSGSPAKSQAEEVQIYEDPFTPDEAGAQANGDRKVLGELPVNENIRVQSPTQSNGSSQSPTGSPRQEAQPTLSTPQDRAELLRNRKLLTSGIERIRGRTLDAHGFRRLQDIAKSHLDIWEGGKRYDELMVGLLDYLQTFDKDPKLSQQSAYKASALKAQALGLTRGLMVVQRKWAAPWYPKVIATVLVCRKSVDGSSHLLADLERTAEDVVKAAQPEACIDSILDFLHATTEPSSPRSTAMALGLLRSLLTSVSSHKKGVTADRKICLVQTTAKYLDDADAEVRKVDVELASDLFGLFGSSKDEFWAEFKGTDEGRLGLLTYYIAKRGREA